MKYFLYNDAATRKYLRIKAKSDFELSSMLSSAASVTLQ
jgi:hypothetical protein